MATAVITPSHVASNYIPFREFDSVTKGFEACEIEGKLAVPFVVRASSLALSGINKGDVGGDDSSWPSLAKIRKQLGLEGYIEGYSCVNNEKISMSGADTLIAHDNCKLNHNVIDSISTRSSTSLLSEQMIKLNKTSRVEEQHWLAYVVSPVSNHIGALHCDPPFGSNFSAEEQTSVQVLVFEFVPELINDSAIVPEDTCEDASQCHLQQILYNISWITRRLKVRLHFLPHLLRPRLHLLFVKHHLTLLMFQFFALLVLFGQRSYQEEQPK